MLFNSLKIAFSMYSKIPMPKTKWNEDNMRYTMCFFPLIGVVIAALWYLWELICNYFATGTIFFAAGVVVIPVLITGGIHSDGFIDTSDAINSYKTKEEKLEILKDSHIGAFALISLSVYLIIYFAMAESLYTDTLLIAGVGCVLSRALSGMAVVSFKGAKDSGLNHMFANAAVKKTVKITMVIYIILSLIGMAAINLIIGSLCFIGALLMFWYYKKMSYNKFGGITGDLSGWFLQMCEITIISIIAVCTIIGV